MGRKRGSGTPRSSSEELRGRDGPESLRGVTDVPAHTDPRNGETWQGDRKDKAVSIMRPGIRAREEHPRRRRQERWKRSGWPHIEKPHVNRQRPAGKAGGRTSCGEGQTPRQDDTQNPRYYRRCRGKGISARERNRVELGGERILRVRQTGAAAPERAARGALNGIRIGEGKPGVRRMKCPRCGAENIEGATWCYLCNHAFKPGDASGTRGVFPPQPPSPDSISTPQGGHMPPVPTPPPPPRRATGGWPSTVKVLSVILVVLVLVGGILGAAFLLVGRKASIKVPTPPDGKPWTSIYGGGPPC